MAEVIILVIQEVRIGPLLCLRLWRAYVDERHGDLLIEVILSIDDFIEGSLINDKFVVSDAHNSEAPPSYAFVGKRNLHEVHVENFDYPWLDFSFKSNVEVFAMSVNDSYLSIVVFEANDVEALALRVFPNIPYDQFTRSDLIDLSFDGDGFEVLDQKCLVIVAKHNHVTATRDLDQELTGACLINVIDNIVVIEKVIYWAMMS